MSRYARQAQRIRMRIRQMFPEADVVQIRRPKNKMFVLIGEMTFTDNDPGQWMKNREPVDFKYVDRTVVASGHSMHEVIRSAKKHKRFTEMSTAEYLEERLGEGFEGLPTREDYLWNALKEARKKINRLEEIKDKAAKVVDEHRSPLQEFLDYSINSLDSALQNMEDNDN